MNKKPITVSLDLEEFSKEKFQDLLDVKPWMKTREFTLINDIRNLRDFIDRAITAGKCVIDFETTGLNTRTKKIKDPATGQITKVPVEHLVGVGLCYESKASVYIPMKHYIGENLEEALVLEELRRLCAFCIVIFHNAKFDMSQLHNRGIFVDGAKKFEDTQLLARLYNANQKDLKLKNLSERLLNQPMLKFKEITQSTNRFDLVDPQQGYYYGASDAICTFDLYNFFMASPIVQEQTQIYNIEKRVVFAVMKMEANLVRIDVEFLKIEKDKVQKKLKDISQDIFTLAKHEFNIGSPQQLGKVLFEELGFKSDQPRTASGQYATDNAALKKLAQTQPICKKLIAYRSLEKSLGTYIENLINNVDEDGCVKFGFHQSGTDTGRFSSPGGSGLLEDGYSGVNVQSVPKATKDDDSGEDLPDIRRSVIARDGKTIVAADYENEEMRVAANLSNETTWIDAVNKGIDFHTATGAIISGKSTDAVTPEERKLGKTTNFLCLFLGGARTLAGNAGISEAEAKRILNAFFAGVPRLKTWIDREIKKARKSKIVKTLLGRVRPLSEFYDSEDRGLQNHGDRCVINTQVQGICADIMKTVMAKIHSWILVNNLEEDVKVLITMHDELVFEVTTEKLELLVPEITKIMMLREVINDVFKWPIPLTVDVKYGNSWRVKKKFYEDFPHTRARLSEPLMKLRDLNLKSPIIEAVMKDLPPKEMPPAEAISLDISTQPVVEDKNVYSNPSPEIILENKPSAINEKEFLYILRDTGDITVLHLNAIIKFILKEQEKNPDRYVSPKKILRVRDQEGSSLMVSEYLIPVDLFLGLARFFKI